MAFWKKSDDPWDINPEKRKKKNEAVWREEVPAEPSQQESLGDVWRSLFKKKEEEDTAIPDAAEKCPWCGKDMEWGMIGGVGRESSVLWRNWQPKGLLDLAGTENGKMFDLLDEGGGMRWSKTVWLCEDCGKMVLDRPRQRVGPNYVWEGGKVKLPETELPSQWNEKEEETT